MKMRRCDLRLSVDSFMEGFEWPGTDPGPATDEILDYKNDARNAENYRRHDERVDGPLIQYNACSIDN